VDRGACPEHN